MREVIAITKALADRSRVRALLALRQQELCVCQIIELLDLAPSTVSKHMSVLHQARLVESRKEGRWVHYRLAGEDAPAEATEAIEWIFRSLSGDPDIRRDAERLKDIVKMDPEALCREQSRAQESPTAPREIAEPAQ